MLISRPNCYCLQKMRSLLKAQFQESSAQGTCLQPGWTGAAESETLGGRDPCHHRHQGVCGVRGTGRVPVCLQVGPQQGGSTENALLPQLTGRWASPEANAAP